MPVLQAVGAFHLPLDLPLKQILDQSGVEEASVGIFLHQDVDHLLGLFETRRVCLVNVLPRFLSCHRVQIDLN